MKKVLLLAAALAFTGLVGVGGSATAADYPGTVTTPAKPSVKPVYTTTGNKATVKVKYKAGNGNLKAKGKLTIRIWKHGHIVKQKVIKYTGANQKITLGKFKKGKYKVVFKLDPKKKALKNSKVTKKFTVKKR